MEGQILTRRWLRVRSVHLTKVIASGLTGRCEVMSPDAEGQRPIDSSKVLERENHDRTRPVSANQTLAASGHTVNTGVWGILTGAFGHPVEAHDSSFFSRCYKYHLHSCVVVLLLIPTAGKHLRECQEEQDPSEVIEI